MNEDQAFKYLLSDLREKEKTLLESLGGGAHLQSYALLGRGEGAVAEMLGHLAGMKDGRSRSAAAIDAVAEVGNPTIVATLTVVAALLPMLFVSGLMGPYMSPIPANASAAMIFSFFVAVIITPWLMV